jgi:RNase E specificity factor CsrD
MKIRASALYTHATSRCFVRHKHLEVTWVYNGMSSIISGQLPEQVLARTDTALAKAQTEGINNWAFQQQDTDDNQFGKQDWRNIIEEIIAKHSLMLLHQPIQAIHRNMKGYQEIFTRFIGENNSMIPTDTVFAMAQRVDLYPCYFKMQSQQGKLC